MSFRPIAAAVVVALLCAARAQAGEADPSVFTLRSYGTFGVVHSSETEADYILGIQMPEGAGHTHSWDWGVDSKIAVQVDARISDKLSAVVQLVSERRYDGDYGPDLEWANLKYQVTDDLSVRVGRVVMPFFMLSDFRKVGYATPWVRPPVEVYGQVPINNTDGIDASYSFRVGKVQTTLQAIYGEITGNIPVASFTARDMVDLNATLVYGPATLRLGYFQQRLDAHMPTEPLFDAFNDFGAALSTVPDPIVQDVGAEARAIYERYQSINKVYQLLNVGMTYDDGQWLAMSEWTLARSHSIIRDTTSWYATVGRRVGPFTPYVSFAREREDTAKSDQGLTVASLPPGVLSEAAGALNGALNGVLTFLITGQKTATLGVRWDFMRTAALKLQYDRVSLDSGSAGFFVNLQPGFERGGAANVVSVNVDYAF